MSHMSEIKFQPKNWKWLQKACKNLGFTLQEGGQVNYYAGSKAQGYTHSISVPGCNWNIGVKKEGENVALAADYYGQEGRKLQEASGRLTQAYAEVGAREFARKKGYQMRSVKEEGEEIVMTLVRH